MKIHAEMAEKSQVKDSLRDAHTPQPAEIVLDTMTYRRREKVQRKRDCVSYVDLQ